MCFGPESAEVARLTAPAGGGDHLPVFSTADLFDDHAERLTSCTLQLRDLGGVEAFCGPIRAVSVDDDNLDVHELLAEPGNGSVLVIDNGGSLRVAMIGDKMAARAHDNGWAGLVIHGAVRDVTALRRVQVGIRALGANPARASKRGGGVRDGNVEFGEAVFRTGEWLYADADGVVVTPRPLG